MIQKETKDKAPQDKKCDQLGIAQGNETHNILYNFEIQKYHPISSGRPEF